MKNLADLPVLLLLTFLFSMSVTLVQAQTPPVDALYLIDASNSANLGALSNSTKINLALGNKLTIEAYVKAITGIKSVVFDMDGTNRVRVEGRVNLDLALERPEPDLHLLETIDCPGRRRPPDAAQPHHRSHHVHAQILPPNPRHLETQDDLVSRLEHISRRLPAISAPQAVGEFAVQLDQGMGTILLGNPSSPA